MFVLNISLKSTKNNRVTAKGKYFGQKTFLF